MVIPHGNCLVILLFCSIFLFQVWKFVHHEEWMKLVGTISLFIMTSMLYIVKNCLNTPSIEQTPNVAIGENRSNSLSATNTGNGPNIPNRSSGPNSENEPNIFHIPNCIENQNVEQVNSAQPVALNTMKLLAHVKVPKHNPMECHICKELYGNKHKKEPDIIPKFLKCGHTVCSNCITRFGQTSQLLRSLKCPFCIKWSSYEDTIENIPINAAIVNVVEKRRRKKWIYWITRRDLTKLLPKCKTCNKVFTPFDGDRGPWANLKCGHTTCERCLKSAFGNGTGVIKCSDLECTHVYIFNSRNAEWDSHIQRYEWKEEFNKNYAIVEILH
ncbi:unnamed protein product [Caenorhabditis brenneri]